MGGGEARYNFCFTTGGLCLDMLLLHPLELQPADCFDEGPCRKELVSPVGFQERSPDISQGLRTSDRDSDRMEHHPHTAVIHRDKVTWSQS